MKVLVIGGGGREHAIVWALSKSARVTEIVCAPGNAGIAQSARCVAVNTGDLAAMLRVVESERPALTVVGPELPLSLGLVDELLRLGLRVFGPTQAAARLETSKSFAKDFMQRHAIPTAAYAVCRSLDDVRRQLPHFAASVVVKADGLAAGKGVVLCNSHAEAEQAATEIFSGALLGTAEKELVLEEFLDGEELSFFALCDGKHAVALAAAQDHKRIGQGDTGPNTGGMGAYTADGLMSAELEQWLLQNVAQPVVDQMAREGSPFQGILFCGMMMARQSDGSIRPMVLEFNARFGDPETEAILVRLESDIVDLFDAAIDGTADSLAIRINGLDSVRDLEAVVFHAGTAAKDGAIVTAGGRVLAVTAVSSEPTPAATTPLQNALAKAYAALEKISFEGMQFRRDIGWRALRDGL